MVMFSLAISCICFQNYFRQFYAVLYEIISYLYHHILNLKHSMEWFPSNSKHYLDIAERFKLCWIMPYFVYEISIEAQFRM